MNGHTDDAAEAATNSSDQNRVRAMLEAGKLNPEEAKRLIAALNDVAPNDAALNDIPDVANAESKMDEATREVAREAEPVQTPPPEEAVRQATRAPQMVPTSTSKTGELPEALRWVRVSVLAGDLDIRVDASLSEPAVDSEPSQFEVEREGEDYVVRAVRRDKTPRRDGIDGLIDGVSELVSGIVGRIGGDLDLRIPAGFGVVLDSKSGDVDVQGVPFVKANLLAGDLDLRDVGGIDLSMSAGDVDASLRLTSGKHRIKVSAGDVDVTLLGGSSVAVTGAVSMGDVDAAFPLTAKRTGMGGSLSGQVGGGEASFELSVSAGDLEVRCG